MQPALPIVSATTRPSASEWKARLVLRYERRDGRTVLAQREHVGPLVVQRPFYPEGPEECHTILVHPPPGIAEADHGHAPESYKEYRGAPDLGLHIIKTLGEHDVPLKLHRDVTVALKVHVVKEGAEQR